MTEAHTTPNSPTPISEILKSETSDLHRQAEKHPFQQAIVKGAAGREGYTAYLGQMLALHGAIDSALKSSAGDPIIAGVVTPEQYQCAYLEEDLRYFGIDPASVEANPSTASLGAWIASLDAPALLGVHYVLEGSNNGGRYIAMALRKSMGLSEDGTRYLDPYGERQREIWASFKTGLDALELTGERREAMLNAAKRMFRGMCEIFDELPAPAGV